MMSITKAVVVGFASLVIMVSGVVVKDPDKNFYSFPDVWGATTMQELLQHVNDKKIQEGLEGIDPNDWSIWWDSKAVPWDKTVDEMEMKKASVCSMFKTETSLKSYGDTDLPSPLRKVLTENFNKKKIFGTEKF